MAVLASAARAQSPQQLWVLQEPDQIIEYDVAGFAAQRALTIPHLPFAHPEYLSVSATGQMLFVLPSGVQWGTAEIAEADRSWFYDGHQTQALKVHGTQIQGRSEGTPTSTETVPRVLLSTGGDSLFWFENEFEKVLDESGLERSVRSAWQAWRTDLAGHSPERIAGVSSSAWRGAHATPECVLRAAPSGLFGRPTAWWGTSSWRRA